MKQFRLLIIALSTALLVACGGGGATVENTTTNTTMGQELMDLDASYKKGLLTEKEYQRAKKNIMNRYD
jgi:hypothetical protein